MCSCEACGHDVNDHDGVAGACIHQPCACKVFKGEW